MIKKVFVFVTNSIKGGVTVKFHSQHVLSWLFLKWIVLTINNNLHRILYIVCSIVGEERNIEEN